ncbi:multidrug effflux MFS transporter [Kineococcus aurantiacus]|uniref:DHA1 family bicyclomycin/chloramphenicol resistance-like MFS transporter n=1 Tax=Kineococcus aurantiacus TaxID=37633 RepID=A0A7Y9DLJ9_9ACTN|nr:multidrug effflux MFS transporter [Kineococcus aurantiacus]NYD22848.1 DHA1 family bicyclomycin/chloramphenicol resistance-like MFS transporter [Kineococcus aurantiacus]
MTAPPTQRSARATAARATPRTPSTVGLVVLLGAMAALGAVTIDLYLPSLPQVAVDLSTTEARTQLTITGVLVGAGFGQLVVGPLSDAFGRRKPAAVGFSVYVVATLLCAIAPNLPTLVAFRVLSGIGASAGAVVGMAVIRDLFTGPAAARLQSRLVLVIGVAPLFAPTVGGAIAAHTGWRPVLALLAVAGLGVLVAVWRRLPETRPELTDTAAQARAEPERAPVTPPRPGRVLRTFTGYGALLRDGRFLAFAAMPGLALATIMAYVSTSVFVLQDGFGLSGTGFAVYFAINGTALVGGTQLNAALVERFGSARLLRVGVVAALVFGLALAAALLARTDQLVLFAAPLYLLLLALGLIMPNAVTLALEPYGDSAGAAAALVTALQSGVGGLVGVLVGLLGGDEHAMGVVVGAAVVLNVVLLLSVSRKIRPRVAA